MRKTRRIQVDLLICGFVLKHEAKKLINKVIDPLVVIRQEVFYGHRFEKQKAAYNRTSAAW